MHLRLFPTLIAPKASSQAFLGWFVCLSSSCCQSRRSLSRPAKSSTAAGKEPIKRYTGSTSYEINVEHGLCAVYKPKYKQVKKRKLAISAASISELT